MTQRWPAIQAHQYSGALSFFRERNNIMITKQAWWQLWLYRRAALGRLQWLVLSVTWQLTRIHRGQAVNMATVLCARLWHPTVKERWRRRKAVVPEYDASRTRFRGPEFHATPTDPRDWEGETGTILSRQQLFEDLDENDSCFFGTAVVNCKILFYKQELFHDSHNAAPCSRAYRLASRGWDLVNLLCDYRYISGEGKSDNQSCIAPWLSGRAWNCLAESCGQHRRRRNSLI